MADEYSQPPYNRDVGIPEAYNWKSLRSRKGAELANKPGMLGQIFTKSQNKIQDRAKLSRLIDMVNDTDWVMLGADTKGAIYADTGGVIQRKDYLLNPVQYAR